MSPAVPLFAAHSASLGRNVTASRRSAAARRCSRLLARAPPPLQRQLEVLERLLGVQVAQGLAFAHQHAVFDAPNVFLLDLGIHEEHVGASSESPASKSTALSHSASHPETCAKHRHSHREPRNQRMLQSPFLRATRIQNQPAMAAVRSPASGARTSAFRGRP